MASTIQVDKITDIGGNTIISSNGSGTFTSNLPAVAPNVSTATGTLPIANGGTGAATLAAAGLTNTPAFFVALTTNVSISDNTFTKIPFATEVYDTDNAYDASTNHRFTVPSGQAGKYCFTFQGPMGILKHYQMVVYLKKNGSYIGTESLVTNGYEQSADTNITNRYTTTLDLAVADYIEMWVKINNNGTSSAFLHGDSYTTFFAGHKLIG
tara:strand:+ start:15 stop:647 length:633 start_codon:yes stop_codon:yes gene_type:complete